MNNPTCSQLHQRDQCGRAFYTSYSLSLYDSTTNTFSQYFTAQLVSIPYQWGRTNYNKKEENEAKNEWDIDKVGSFVRKNKLRTSLEIIVSLVWFQSQILLQHFFVSCDNRQRFSQLSLPWDEIKEIFFLLLERKMLGPLGTNQFASIAKSLNFTARLLIPTGHVFQWRKPMAPSLPFPYYLIGRWK